MVFERSVLNLEAFQFSILLEEDEGRFGASDEWTTRVRSKGYF
jgi:hypothetical protein